MLNLAIEGKMLLGAFIAVAVLYKTGYDPLVGVLAATIAGGILGLIFALLYLRIRINLIILALAVNLFISNATVFFMRTVFGSFGTLADPSVHGLPTLEIPLLKDIPYLGALLERLQRRRLHQLDHGGGGVDSAVPHAVWTRHLRAVGENQAAAESVGINVTRVQVIALTLSGMLAGLAGSFLSIGILSQFVTDMTAGRGWIAITVSLFAFEQPIPAFFTALFFGLSEAMAFYLQSRPELDLPPDLLLAFPQIATVAALVFVALRIRAGELIKRRNFAAQFGRELDKLRRGQLAGD